MDFVKQIVALLAAFLFTRLVNAFPNFPLTGETFVNLVLWIVSLTGIITYPLGKLMAKLQTLYYSRKARKGK
jgi:hypothetical protein